MPTSKGSAVWEGGIKDGKGSFKNGRGGISASYGFASRFEDGPGSNPEELLAMAHAACFTMALSLSLEKAGKKAKHIDTNAACTLEKVGEGFKITRMHLDCKADVPGLDAATFQKIAEATKEACPVSGALKGNVQIQLESRLTNA